MEDQFNKEIQEAIQAANHALACLSQADAYLQSAKTGACLICLAEVR